MEQKRNQNYLQNGQSHRETSDRPDRPDSQNRDSHEIIINTTGRNNCGGRCLIHVHMKDGKIERLRCLSDWSSDVCSSDLCTGDELP